MTNEELYRQYLSGDTEAFEQLYLQMQGFIASVAKDAAQSFGCSDKETLDELCAEGALELCERLSTGEYDENRGKLTTYLHPFLRGRMYRYMEANLGVMALSKDEMQRVRSAQQLYYDAGKSTEEIAAQLGVSENAAAKAIAYNTHSAGAGAPVLPFSLLSHRPASASHAVLIRQRTVFRSHKCHTNDQEYIYPWRSTAETIPPATPNTGRWIIRRPVTVLSFFCIHHKLYRQYCRQSEATDEALLRNLFGHHVVGILDDQQQVLVLFGQAFDQTLESILGL